ncbi:MAG: hypothetical protein GXP29_01980 [Planctomycetes bacterium]|nr:hypothetical protein [Planctomycetota bacterium]
MDGEPCAREDFVCKTASHDAVLGCRIEVRDTEDLTRWHQACNPDRYSTNDVLVNFHGQVVALDYHPVSDRNIHVLVDLTGEPTGIRLMLPARTALIQNGATTQLQDAIQMEVYRHVLRRGYHTLPYEQYLYARQRGIDLPEATPTYSVGLLPAGDVPEPVRAVMPEGFDLARCYRFDDRNKRNVDIDEANAHLLTALGTLDEPFVPVAIQRKYFGYSWAKLPTITKVEVQCGKQFHSDTVWSGELSCVDSIVIAVHTSDGKAFSSRVCMAVVPSPDKEPSWTEDHVVITAEAETRLCSSEIWFHLGGFSDEGDTYDTQEYQFERELDAFWTGLHGPDEQRRRDIMEALCGLKPAWQSVRVEPNGHMRIRFADRTVKIVTPAQSSH